MKKLTLATGFLLLFMINCNSDEQVLAEFEGGAVKRKDLKNFYQMRDYPINEQTASIANQTKALENLAIQALIQKETENEKFTEKEEYKSIYGYAEKSLVANLTTKNFLEKLKDNESLELATIQFIYLKAIPNALQKEPKNKENAVFDPNNPNAIKAEEVLKEISSKGSEKEINEYISKNTEDESRKSINGYLEPQCINCANQNLVDTVFKEGIEKKDKKFYKSIDDRNIFIYRVLSIDKVKSSDLEKFLKKKFSAFRDLAIEYTNTHQTEQDKSQAAYFLEDEPRLSEKSKMTADHYIKKFEEKAWPKKMEELMAKSEIKLTEELSLNGQVDPKLLSDEILKPEKVLISSPKFTYTVQNLEDEFKQFHSSKLVQRKDSYNSVDKIRFLQSFILPVKLLADGELGEETRKSSKYLGFLDSMKKELTFSFFLKNLEEKNNTVSEKEISETYEASKMFAYAKADPKDPQKKIPLPFAEVKDRIKQELIKSKTEAEVQKAIQSYKEKYKLKYNTDKLKAGTV
ncbi:MAG: hypothetical protein SFU98_18600 [Leptospiraceae bacterium]|nr:hypothetical protein [Leptospiraceae bacterium]